MTNALIKENKNDIKIGDNLIDKIGKNYHIVSEFDINQKEWEKKRDHYLVFIGCFENLNVYLDAPYGDYIITERTFDKKIIEFTKNNFVDLRHSITRVFFKYNNVKYQFDSDNGLYKLGLQLR